MKNSLTLSVLIVLSFSCQATYPPLEVVPSVDLERYVGVWYEIASLPVPQQEGCSCTTAEYSVLENGDIRVVNTCRQGASGEEVDEVEGTAFVVPGSNNAKLEVQFFWPFRGDYWIIELADDYSWAVVGVPSRKYVWVLARTQTMEKDTLDMLLARAREKGFDVSNIQYTNHNCGNE